MMYLIGRFGDYFELFPVGYETKEDTDGNKVSWIIFDFYVYSGGKQWDGTVTLLSVEQLTQLRDWFTNIFITKECADLKVCEPELTFHKELELGTDQEAYVRIYFNGITRPKWAMNFRDNLVWADVYLNEKIRDILIGRIDEWIERFAERDQTINMYTV